MFQIIILSIIIAFLSIIILRGYDKFNNKQFTRKTYINQFLLVLISSLIVLYVDNHFSNYSNNNLINNNIQKGGSSLNNNTTTSQSFTNIHNNNKPSSFIESGINKFKMNFDTGLPNF